MAPAFSVDLGHFNLPQRLHPFQKCDSLLGYLLVPKQLHCLWADALKKPAIIPHGFDGEIEVLLDRPQLIRSQRDPQFALHPRDHLARINGRPGWRTGRERPEGWGDWIMPYNRPEAIFQEPDRDPGCPSSP